LTPDVPVEARPLRAIGDKGIISYQELLSIARQMKVFRTSKMPWFRLPGRFARGLGRLIKTAAMLGMLGLVVTVMLWRSRGCFTELLAKYARRFRLQLRGQHDGLLA
jgi:hypothetical protein